MTCALVLYVCLGTPAGYISARIYKSKCLPYIRLTYLTNLNNWCKLCSSCRRILLASSHSNHIMFFQCSAARSGRAMYYLQRSYAQGE